MHVGAQPQSGHQNGNLRWISIIIILDPDERRRPTTTVRSNDTLVDTPFQLISDFFHVNQGVLCCAGVCWRGGGQQAC